MPLRLTFAGTSDIGRQRSSNQDRWSVRDDLQLAAMADGLGGLPYGAEAAQAAIDTLALKLRLGVPEDPDGWHELLDTINDAIVTLARQLSSESGIGTTLTIARCHHNRLQFAHIGDSALFRLRAGKLEQLTREHTVASEILERRARGLWQPMPANAAHVLTSCLGLPHLGETDIRETDLQAGDRLLLCTDGLTKPVESQKICDTLGVAESPASAAQALVDLANDEGGPDNITVVVGFCEATA